MRRLVVRSIVVALALTGTVGCQSMSMPKMAWFKRSKPPEAESAVAKTTAPKLPSTQAKPQAIAGTGIDGALPPSSANLAAARGATGSTTASTALTTAPLAAPGAALYPSTGAPAPTYPVSSASSVASSAPASPTATPAQGGPYDPNSYRPSASSLASPAASGGDRYATAPGMPAASATSSADRYGLTPASTSMPVTTPMSGNSALATAPSSTQSTLPLAGTDDRYAMPPANDYGSRYATVPPAPAATETMPASAAAGSRYADTPAPAQVGVPASAVSATAQATMPAGQYRPGGTSNYSSGASDHIEVATRPTSVSTPSMPAESSTPAYPPMPELPATSGATRPY